MWGPILTHSPNMPGVVLKGKPWLPCLSKLRLPPILPHRIGTAASNTWRQPLDSQASQESSTPKRTTARCMPIKKSQVSEQGKPQVCRNVPWPPPNSPKVAHSVLRNAPWFLLGCDWSTCQVVARVHHTERNISAPSPHRAAKLHLLSSSNLGSRGRTLGTDTQGSIFD